MPRGASADKLSAAELKELEEQVHRWKKFLIGREVVKKVGKGTVEGIVFSVDQDKLQGPPARLTSTYVILWDQAGLNRSKRNPRPLSNLLPGEAGVEQEIASGEQLQNGSMYSLRSWFSHPELMLPWKMLQEHQWRWKSMAAAQQRLLLEWTPMDEHAARQKRARELGDATIANMVAKRDAEEAAAGRACGPRRDVASGRNRPANVASPAQKRAEGQKRQKRGESPTDEGSQVKGHSDGAAPDDVSGSSGSFADAREDASSTEAEEDPLADFTPTGRPPPELPPRRRPPGQQPAPAVGTPASDGKADGGGHGAGAAAANGAAAATKAAGGAPKCNPGPSALNDLIELPAGSDPPAVPTRLTLSAGDRLVQEYKDQLFASDEEFEPEHIVAQRPAGQPREYLVKWRNYELDPGDWSAYADLAETKALDAWERARPPPQGAGKPPPPLPKSAKKGSAKRKQKR